MSDITRVRILSDLHHEFPEDFKLPEVKSDVVILAGDTDIGTAGVTWARKAFPDLPVIYIPGNHEFYHHGMPSLISELKEAAQGSNVHVLDRESITIDGVRFLGCTLWTDFSLFGKNYQNDAMRQAGKKIADFDPMLGRIKLTGPGEDPRYPTYFTPLDAQAVFNENRRWLTEQLRDRETPTVVVTHHAPSGRSFEPGKVQRQTDAAYAAPLDQLVTESKAQIWIHGHIHNSNDYTLGQTRVISNPKGYYLGQNEGFSAELVAEVFK